MTKIKFNVKCPKCGLPSFTFTFKRKIYLVDSKGESMMGVLYGCDKCNIAFTMTTDATNKTKPIEENVDKIQSVFGKLSKGCNKILENIK